MKKFVFLFIISISLCLGNFLLAEEKAAQPGVGPASPAEPAKTILSPKRKAELEKASNEIKSAAEKKELNVEEKERAVFAFERLVKNGIPVKPAKEVVSVSIRQGLKSEEIDNVTDTIIERKEKVHPENLGKDVQELLRRGLRGKELAGEIHKIIEYRHQMKMAEQKKKREEKKAIKQERKKEHQNENEPPDKPEDKKYRGTGGGHPGNPGGGKRN